MSKLATPVKVRSKHQIIHNTTTIAAGKVFNISDADTLDHLEDAGAVERVYDTEEERAANAERVQQEKFDRVRARHRQQELKELPSDTSPPVLAGASGQEQMAGVAARRQARTTPPEHELDPNGDNGKTVGENATLTLGEAAKPTPAQLAHAASQKARKSAEDKARAAGKNPVEVKAAGDAAVASLTGDGLGT